MHKNFSYRVLNIGFSVGIGLLAAVSHGACAAMLPDPPPTKPTS